jgi:hypothetical protein
LALIVSSAEDLFWPVAIAVALLFPIGCGFVYCLLARGVARGSRTDLNVIVVVSAVLFVPYLLLGFIEAERTMAYDEAIKKFPIGHLLDLLLYGVQLTALFVHAALLVWIVWAGIRARRAMAGTIESGSAASHRPSLWANLLLVLVGILAGYLWTLVGFFLSEQLGLRGQMHPTEFGGHFGEKDKQVVSLIVFLSAAAIIVSNLLFRWRWWGISAGVLTGLALSFIALTH